MADVLVVVAAGPGLGLAVARRFAREGCPVGLVARSQATLDGLSSAVRSTADVPVATATADVADEAALRAALGALSGRLGDPDVLVYNGSAYVEGSGLTLATADLRRAFDVGVTGAMVAAQEVAPAMLRRGAGTVLLTGSVAAERGSRSAAAVGVAKAGLRNLALSLHEELAPAGVRVVTVTIDGVLAGPRALDLDAVADLYWLLHTGPQPPPAVVNHP